MRVKDWMRMEKGTYMKPAETGTKSGKERERKTKEPSKIIVSHLTTKWIKKKLE